MCAPAAPETTPLLPQRARLFCGAASSSTVRITVTPPAAIRPLLIALLRWPNGADLLMITSAFLVLSDSRNRTDKENIRKKNNLKTVRTHSTWSFKNRVTECDTRRAAMVGRRQLLHTARNNNKRRRCALFIGRDPALSRFARPHRARPMRSAPLVKNSPLVSATRRPFVHLARSFN